MPEPDSIQFECIGCGTMNPASAEICAGCGHRFRGETGSQAAMKPLPPGEGRRFGAESELMAYRAPARIERQDRGPRSTGEVILNAVASLVVLLFGVAAIVLGLGISVFIGFFSLCLGSRNAIAPIGICLSVLLFLGIAFGTIKLIVAFFRNVYKR